VGVQVNHQVRPERELLTKNDAFFAGLALDETALAALESASASTTLNTVLLQTAPARDLRIEIERVVELLESLDHQTLLKKQSWFSKLTGADVQARLEFEISAQEIVQAIAGLRRAAANGREMIPILHSAVIDLQNDQARFERLIQDARQMLQLHPNADPFIRDRFERRLSHIMVIHASNTMTIEQMRLGVSILLSIIDRFVDVDVTLFPLWQRHSIAVLHASDAGVLRRACDDLKLLNSKIVTHLKTEITS
jgi:hypothetical protein